MRLKKKNQKRSNSLNVQNKDRKKHRRTVVQAIFLLFIFSLLFMVAFNHERYKEPDKSEWQSKNGFVALSYFGVSRSGSQTLIAKDQLDQHLQVLKEHGYTTVSQQDILNYYHKGEPLPERALYLSFEDGRNDSSIFAQRLLEKYNYKATILSYANKFGEREFKFLQPKDLLDMRETGYWELGSNGYRLTYINILYEDGSFVLVRDESEFQPLETEFYNHYLMDFIRDENEIPIENRQVMEERINKDYMNMKEIYTSELGFVPSAYMIMHANSLYNGMNDLVENTNDGNIKSLFKLHFNREGYAVNDLSRDVYDLTRVQPAPHWSINHLLMKLKQDTEQTVNFEIGDEELAKDWQIERGAAEFTGNKIIVTSPPGEEGLVTLKGSHKFVNDYKMTFTLGGVPEGQQSIYFQFNEQEDNYLRLGVEDNKIVVSQKLANEQETLRQATIERTELIDVELVIKNDQLNISINDSLLLERVPFNATIKEGSVALIAKPLEIAEDEQAYDDLYYKGDDIYDAVFYDIKITELDNEGEASKQIFSNNYTGFQKVMKKAEDWMNIVVDWTVETF